ncbi:MAG TPA: 16S rRNA (guanine(966)-N(2))-methyltransferase RsmD [Thermoanaerobaculia bacterium]|nr:16S rRNA (guanine(966)-N(2))-methyltransferase RsmD [Thermoanaerobaculia bacterium]
MSTLRITAGTLKGRRVPVPKDDVRPTSERARQAFFNIAAARIEGARFLDLFAGSGIFSFEALSRGAVLSVAVDSAGQQLATIERLALEWRVPLRTVRAELPRDIRRVSDNEFDVVYADPPYAFGAYDALLNAIGTDLRLPDDALVAIEHRRRVEPFTAEPQRLRFVRRAEYGEVWISLFEPRRPGRESGTTQDE